MQMILVVAALLPFMAGAYPSSENVPWMHMFRNVEETDPKPCCFPDTWEGMVESNVAESITRKPGTFKVHKTMLAVDGARKRVAAKTYCPYMDKEVGGFIGLFNEKTGVGFTMYFFSKMKPDKCFSFKSATAVYKKTCIPENAKFKGSYDLGLTGSGFSVNSFDFEMKTSMVKMKASAEVTKNCVPVIYREAGKIGGCKEEQTPRKKLFFTTNDSEELTCGGKKFVVNAFYHNLTPGIKDASVFNLPEACKKAPVEVSMEAEEVGDEQFQRMFEGVKSFMNYVVV